MTLKTSVRKLIDAIPQGQSWRLGRWINEPQPARPKAKVVFTVLTKAGADANGKVSSYDFLPPFCNLLRRNNFATAWASSTRELSRVFKDDVPVILIHLFGEDRVQIASPEVLALEEKAIASFNSAQTGLLLADKLASHEAFSAAGVPLPALRAAGGFTRERFGTALPTSVEDKAADLPVEDVSQIRTEFVDTRVRFKSQQYYTTVRLLCVDDIILHAYTRARNEKDGDASVHNKNTPVEPELIEYLHQTQVLPRLEVFADIANKLHQVLGHGFFAHDLVIDTETGATFVCEGGFKFSDQTYYKRFAPVSSQLPSQSVLFPVHEFAESSARAFMERCHALLRK